MEHITEKPKYLFGLVGKNIDYSFSRAYFSKKFEKENLNQHSYINFDINTIEDFENILSKNPNICGLNVTIPYKEAVIPYLDKIDKKALKIGAVNTIKFTKKGQYIGYNTDWYGFKKALQPYLKKHHKKALILGTGGASKAIAYTLKKSGIKFNYVSRQLSKQAKYSYNTLSESDVNKHTLIINTTPLGTFPNIDEAPKIPYYAITEKHVVFDLVYNPIETKFLKLAKEQRATTLNGMPMLEYQAEKAWKIWNKK